MFLNLSFIGEQDTLRNGANTQTQNHNRIQNLDESQNTAQNRKNNAVQQNRVLQETWDWYDKCYNRERNAGTFSFIIFDAKGAQRGSF